MSEEAIFGSFCFVRQGWGQPEDAILTTAMIHNTLKRPNTIRFSVRHNRPTAEQIHDNTINCIAELDNSWYNITFNNERYCETIATSGLEVNGMLIDCERADIYHSGSSIRKGAIRNE